MGKGFLAPGKQSGVTASDMAASSDVGEMKPGKSTLVQGQQDIGVQWVTEGPHCDADDGTGSKNEAGCFLKPNQRARLAVEFNALLAVVQSNYKNALLEIKVGEMIKKDDDLNWVLSMALDVIGAHFLGVITKGLLSVKAGGISQLPPLLLELRGDKAASTLAEKALHHISDKNIESWTKLGFSKAQKAGTKVIEDNLNANDKSEKEETKDYISQLTDECDLSFLEFRRHSLAVANDAELGLLVHGLHPSNHKTSEYKKVLQQKIERFKKSGVTDLGRKNARDDLGYSDVHRDKRVIWVKDIGENKTLWYQSQDGSFDPGTMKPGDPGSSRMFPEYAKTSHPFGPHNPVGAAKLERPVPEEFKEAALAKSEALWGATPTMDNPNLRVMGIDPAKAQPAPIPTQMKPMGTLTLKPDPTAPSFGGKKS